jgi:WXG100 family type VII secretion target
MIADMTGGSGMITADSGTLEDGYADLGSALEALTGTLRELDARLSVSLDEWAGPAREAYEAARAQWRESAAQLAGRLAWLRGVISVAHVNYGRAEESVMRAFSEQ